jgi:RimJ/RimL family protein N-acetyltransferase
MSGQLNTILQSSTLPILLRVPEVSDAEALLRILSDPRNTEFDPHAGNGALKLENIEAMIGRMRISAALEVPDRVNLVVVDTSLDNKVVGLGGFGHIGTEDNKRIGDVGIMLDPVVRGKGYGVEAMKLAIGYAFGILKLDEVTSTMLEKNIPMRNLLDKKLCLKGTIRDAEFGLEAFYLIRPEDWAWRSN